MTVNIKLNCKVETYNLTTKTGKHIRKATRVVFPGGTIISFTEKMSKREAINNVITLMERGRHGRL